MSKQKQLDLELEAFASKLGSASVFYLNPCERPDKIRRIKTVFNGKKVGNLTDDQVRDIYSIIKDVA